jgi:hypothetical protein
MFLCVKNDCVSVKISKFINSGMHIQIKLVLIIDIYGWNKERAVKQAVKLNLLNVNLVLLQPERRVLSRVAFVADTPLYFSGAI